MSEGEVVHCVCSHTEGDGMMVQCESCLTWQHGQCLGIDNPNQVNIRTTRAIHRDIADIMPGPGEVRVFCVCLSSPGPAVVSLQH